MSVKVGDRVVCVPNEKCLREFFHNPSSEMRRPVIGTVSALLDAAGVCICYVDDDRSRTASAYEWPYEVQLLPAFPPVPLRPPPDDPPLRDVRLGETLDVYDTKTFEHVLNAVVTSMSAVACGPGDFVITCDERVGVSLLNCPRFLVSTIRHDRNGASLSNGLDGQYLARRRPLAGHDR